MSTNRPSRAKPWPKEAREEVETAVNQLLRIMKLSIALNNLACNQPFALGVQAIAVYLNDAANRGRLALDRPFPRVKRWPKSASSARLHAIETFNRAAFHADKLAKIQRAGEKKQYLIYAATDLNFIVFKALEAFQLAGVILPIDQLTEDNR